MSYAPTAISPIVLKLKKERRTEETLEKVMIFLNNMKKLDLVKAYNILNMPEVRLIGYFKSNFIKTWTISVEFAN